MSALTKNIIIVSLGFLVCLVIGVWLVKPALSRVDELNSELVSKKIELSSLQQQIHAYQTAESDLRKATQKQDILDVILTQEQMEAVFKELEQAANNTQSVEKVKVTDPFLVDSPAPPLATTQAGVLALTSKLNGVVAVPYRLTMEGTYTGISDFFGYLEHLKNFTEVTGFQLSRQEQSAGINAPKVNDGKVFGSIDAIFYSKKNADSPK